MLTYLRNLLLFVLSKALPERLLKRLFRRWHGRHFDALDAEVSDKTLEGLLVAMDLGFHLFPAWRRHIQGFKGAIVFTAKSLADGKTRVQATAIFDGRHMKVDRKAVEAPTAEVIFTSPLALFSFILSRSPDIVEALLANAVETKGNLNYVYRFGFLFMEMTRWLRMPA
jgi:hypothetical protein